MVRLRVLVDDEWVDGYLDYHLGRGQVRIDVRCWAVLGELQEQYFTYTLSDWRRVLNYIRRTGILYLIRKVVSRLRERKRNQKWFSVGLGRIRGHRGKYAWEPGDAVVFGACNHPRCVDRVVVDERFVRPYSEEASSGEAIDFFDWTMRGPSRSGLDAYGGWTPESGWSVDAEIVNNVLSILGRQLGSAADPDRQLPLRNKRSTRERRDAPKSRPGDDLEAVLFGLGNYAKTVIHPNIADGIEVCTVHEIDPLQLKAARGWDVNLDTSGRLRPDEDFDVLFAAGYHHTHTPLAVQSLEAGRDAVVEKPLCTTWRQLERLKQACESGAGRLFAGFHKRYSRFNTWLSDDLEMSDDGAVNYHCIVYEVPLPELHWYNWPNSGSRMLSNGCHWIDHFMYLNDYCRVRDYWGHCASNGDMHVGVELENDASFSMILTDEGSPRLGVRDYVEVRRGDLTARLVDDYKYESENESSVLRRGRKNPMESYERMYESITGDIVDGKPGDELRTLRSTKLVLSLEDHLHQ